MAKKKIIKKTVARRSLPAKKKTTAKKSGPKKVARKSTPSKKVSRKPAPTVRKSDVKRITKIFAPTKKPAQRISKGKEKHTPKKIAKPILKINLKRASKKSIAKERKRLYNIRYRANQKINATKSKKKRRLLTNKILQTSNALKAIRERAGEKFKAPKMQSQLQTVADDIARIDIFRWEAANAIEEALNSVFFKTYIIDGQEFSSGQPTQILIAVGDMDVRAAAEVPPIYYFTITSNFTQKTLTVTM